MRCKWCHVNAEQHMLILHVGGRGVAKLIPNDCFTHTDEQLLVFLLVEFP